jgi:hypothetical protein
MVIIHLEFADFKRKTSIFWREFCGEICNYFSLRTTPGKLGASLLNIAKRQLLPKNWGGPPPFLF